jgi:hypothetical protein
VNKKFDYYVNSVRIGALTLSDEDVLPAAGTVGLGFVWDFLGKYDNFVVRS